MKYNYRLTALTPVHIGNGDSYTKKEYYLSNAKLGEKPIKLINRVNLNNYLNTLPSNEQNKFFNNIKNEKFELKSSMINIKESKIYHSIEVTTKDKNNKLEHPTTIDATIKDDKNKAYIPGSSIKGSIKTAIIYDFLEKENNLSSKKDYETICNKKEIMDIMSKIRISDSTSTKNLKTIQPISLTLKSEGDKRKNDDDKKQGMYNAIECLYKSSMNINIKWDLIDVNKVKECLYYFNYDYIEHELEFYSKIDNSNKVINYYNQLKKFNTKESPLIRIGGSTGLLSTTIGLHMKNNNLDLYMKTFKKDGENVDENFPKIRKLTPNKEPFGWCRFKSIE